MERASAPGFKPGEIIDPALHGALDSLGLQDSFRQLGFPMLAGNVAIWDSHEERDTPAVRNPYGHGVLIDRSVFETWLLEGVRQSGAEVFAGATGLHSARCGASWRLQSDSFDIKAGFAVEATGRSAGQVAPPARRHADHLVCLLAYPEAPADFLDCRLHLEAADNGWWYCALLPGRKLVVALMVDREALVGQGAASRSQWFWSEYEKTKLLPRLLARSQLNEPHCRVRGYPAGSSLRCKLGGAGWMVIGDAAASYDPLFGRGVPVALAKGSASARLLMCGPDLDRQAQRYANTELETFEQYLAEQRTTYQRAGAIRETRFWQSWQVPEERGRGAEPAVI